MRTCALQSGSNGNAIYVEADGVRLLFDAGISGRLAARRLAEHGRDLRTVQALILSHGHSDHTCSAGVLHRRLKAPLYATPGTRRALRTRPGRPDGVCEFQPGDVLRFGAVRVYTLPTPHDAVDAVAFIVETAGKRLGIFTDLGHPTDALRHALAGLDAAYLESNYDPRMLAEGSYPPELKRRIRGDGGHLANEEAALLLKSCGLFRPRWVALAHLSAQNNTPELALAAHRRELGPDYPLYVAGRYGVSPLLEV
ncbi:MAG: MBL fold metallo-hydrolase [Planctomycetota bacterium]